MKELIFYECSICRSRSMDKDGIQRCENSHCKIEDLEIVDIEFEGTNTIPKVINVKVKDKFAYTYVLDKFNRLGG